MKKNLNKNLNYCLYKLNHGLISKKYFVIANNKLLKNSVIQQIIM
jgi:hypothetical protein